MKPVVGKTQDDISQEWDRIARLRAGQIKRYKDLSYNFVLVPCILDLSSESEFTSVVDVGCGSGFLAKHIANKSMEFVGVDMSDESVKIANEMFGDIKNVKFIVSSIENYAKEIKEAHFTLAIANMTLMTTISLKKFVRSIWKILMPKSHFIITITHPCFWPIYWEYADKEWFDYKKEIPIEGIFKISLETSHGFVTTHIHRPIEKYISCLIEEGFIINRIVEPMPDKNVESKYPTVWKFPRFLGIHCIKR
ncbi:MAG: methyltransferase domain-containing protein [Candidatus Eremiobacteraeota bacterium]|nr:methyltransferase domain-containing protein [Candidatus Eremiobacteraeota bacterium]